MKRKKGEFQEAKRRHQEDQALYDAIKKAREEGEALWGDKVLLSPDMACQGANVLVKFDGQISIGLFTDKDGFSVTVGERFRRVQPSEILAVVRG